MALEHQGKRKALGFAACTAASALWGCGFFFGRIALDAMDVGHMVLYRFVFAVIALLPLLVTHPPRFSGRDWGMLRWPRFWACRCSFCCSSMGCR